MRRKPTEYILQAGYWSDEMEEEGEGPDVFFIHFTIHDERDAVELLAEAVDLLIAAWADKYGEGDGPVGVEHDGIDRQDLFWACSARPA